MTKLWSLIAIIIEFKYLNNIRPVFLRNINGITSSVFLISKFSRIPSLQSLFLNFSESNVLLSLGQCMKCFLVSKTIRVFSYSHIKYRPYSDGLRCTYSFSGVPSTVLTLCASVAHGISRRVLCHQSFAPRVLHPSHDAWPCKTSRTQIQVYFVAN